MKALTLWVLFLLVLSLACGQSASPFPNPTYTPRPSIFESDRTAYGFFPTPPDVSFESIVKMFSALGQHADVVLVQENIPWNDFIERSDGKSQKMTDLINLMQLARGNNLEPIFIIDPLNGLNRREFAGLPTEMKNANFGTPQVRAAYQNFTLRILREFHPRYLGLASEINTYADAHPDDFSNFLTLYSGTYDLIKAESPETQVFVTFQWEDLNNFPLFSEGGTPGQIKWERVEVFEPKLDLWVISSYPFAVFKSGADIPADYYTPLLTRTEKPLAVAEGGFSSKPVGNFSGSPQAQVDYLNAIHTQLGARLKFWIYLILDDFDIQAYQRVMGVQNAQGLGLFASVGLREKDGTPKPALDVWDAFRSTAP